MPGSTPPGGFSIALIRSDGLSCTRTSTRTQTFTRNGCKSVGDISSAAAWSNIIYTKAQLFTWNDSRNPSDASDAPILGADIDMEMTPWTPKNFAGTFDGRGHKLYNINVSTNNYAGFLRELTGGASVKDLVIGSSDGVIYDGQSIIKHSKSANNYTWYYAGAIAKVSGTSTVSNVTNFATVEVASDATSKTRIGGIVGRVVAIKDDEDALIIETGSDRVKMKFRKWCISSVDTVKEMPKTDEKKGLFSGFGKKKKDNPAEDKKPE